MTYLYRYKTVESVLLSCSQMVSIPLLGCKGRVLLWHLYRILPVTLIQ